MISLEAYFKIKFIKTLNRKRVSTMNKFCINGKRSQAALEFMTTYGWAIIIILVAIGALTYFGFSNPKAILPDKCLFGNGLVCQDSAITTTAINVSLYNSVGRTIYGLTASPIGFAATCSASPTTASGDVPIKVNCALTTPATQGEKKKFKLFVNYTKTPTGYQQVSLGEIYGTVQ